MYFPCSVIISMYKVYVYCNSPVLSSSFYFRTHRFSLGIVFLSYKVFFNRESSNKMDIGGYFIFLSHKFRGFFSCRSLAGQHVHKRILYYLQCMAWCTSPIYPPRCCKLVHSLDCFFVGTKNKPAFSRSRYDAVRHLHYDLWNMERFPSPDTNTNSSDSSSPGILAR